MKRNYIYNRMLVTFIAIILCSCTKVIDINLNESDPQIIVEGEVNDLPGPYIVKLSKTVNFSDKNTFPPVQGALVNIADDAGNTETLTETQPGVYETNTLQGVVGRTYSLNIQTSGKTITAQSTMPPKVPLDSITYLVTKFEQAGNPNAEERFIPIPRFQDPTVFGNCYRFKRTVNNIPDPTFFVDNDNVINGLQYQRPLFGGTVSAKEGDSLVFEMQCIERKVYDYFNSLNASLGTGPGGSATPANPVTNVRGALGYFSANTAEQKRVKVSR